MLGDLRKFTLNVPSVNTSHTFYRILLMCVVDDSEHVIVLYNYLKVILKTKGCEIEIVFLTKRNKRLKVLENTFNKQN